MTTDPGPVGLTSDGSTPPIAVPGIRRLLLRRSVGRPAMLAVAAVIAANVLLRERDWVHEWQWAWFNYHFVTIFLGPLAAGFGAWEGARLARAGDALDSAGVARRALAGASAAVFAWLLIPYLAGLAAVSAMVVAAGTPGIPGMIEFSTLGPALVFLGAWVVVGVAAGYRARSPLAAPLATIVSFAILLGLYIVNYTLVRVGGATGSLLGLAPRPEIQLGQVVLYVATAVWAWASLPRRSAVDRFDRARRLSGPVGALAMVLALVLFLDRGADFRDRAVPLRCFGAQPEICLAVGYDQHPERVRAALEPMLDGLRAIGAPLPTRMRMGDPSEEDLVGRISNELALGEDNWSPEAGDLISAYNRWSCDWITNRELNQAWHDVYDWLESLAESRPLAESPFTSEVLRTGTEEERAAYLRGAIDRLRRCA